MSEMKQPFMTALFTVSSHHPFVVPDKYKDSLKEEQLPIHKCIRYTDMAIGRFFETARKQAWFKNTIFILVSDHTNQRLIINNIKLILENLVRPLFFTIHRAK